MRGILKTMLDDNKIVGNSSIQFSTAILENEPATSREVDILTNYVGSVQSVVHTITLCVKDVYKNGTVRTKYLGHVNKIPNCFKYHQKVSQLTM